MSVFRQRLSTNHQRILGSNQITRVTHQVKRSNKRFMQMTAMMITSIIDEKR
jgi:hypothetical protein